jgi:fatty-acyl-CoA synthase
MSLTTIGSGNRDLEKPFVLGHAAWLRALERTARLGQHAERTFPALIEELAARFGPAPALISNRETFTFQELAERANQYARWSLEEELQPGTVVGLMMPNRPEYLAIWLGIGRIGCVTALINTNLVGSSLAHCIDAAGMTDIIVTEELSVVLAAALPLTRTQPEIWVHGEMPQSEFKAIIPGAGAFSGRALEKYERQNVTLNDRALCIYTSGTTGFPKAANVSHRRIMAWSHWFAGMMDTKPEDRLYNCLPFYHSMGGVAATGALLVSGGSVFVKEKFSAKSFWREVSEHGCTLFQYIGELCRYLLNAPPSFQEQGHAIRLCCGNGLSSDIWPRFKDRFNIPHILEFYAATEANFSLYNTEEEPGAIGRIPSFLGHRFPIKLIKMNAEALEPVRNEEGLCAACASDEVGEAVFRIGGEAKAGASSFEGYTAEKDSEKKILRDVLAKGDAWYRSGDLMKRNGKGFYFFVDRIGDTFRWKGENVSASEVMHAIAACPGVKEAIVYGVLLPNAEGRAGMAAVATGGPFELSALKDHLDRRLPRYAQPLFLRMIPQLDLTSTFRPKKSSFALEGYDPRTIGDPLYFNDHESDVFVRLDAQLYDQIVSSRIRL